MRKKSDTVTETPVTEVVVPTDPVCEQAVLAAALVDPDTRASLLRRVPVDMFIVEEHRAAWWGLGELSRRNLEYDPVSFQKICGTKVRVSYLAELCELLLGGLTCVVLLLALRPLAPLEGGGVVVGNKIQIALEIEAVRRND